MERIACLSLPQWPIQRLVTRFPELRYQRIVLRQQHPQRGQIVAEASPLALRSGVRLGMPVTEAKSLLRRTGKRSALVPTSLSAASATRSVSCCPTADAPEAFHLLPYEPEVDRAALADLARQLDGFSSLIGWDVTDNAWSLLFDLTGVTHLFGGEIAFGNRLYDHLNERGYWSRLAIAPTIGAAWALAHHAPDSTPNSSTTRPVVHLPDFNWDSLDPLPSAALRLEPAICETLRQLGLTTVGAVRRIPTASLAARFGDAVHRRLLQASGAQPETFRAVSRNLEASEEQILDFPIRDQATILVVIGRQIASICQKLKRNRQGALSWRINLWRAEASPLYLRIGLFQATSLADQILPLVQMQLEQHPDFDGWNHPVEKIAVAADGCVRLVERQGNLFDDASNSNPAALGELLNRLAIRLGEEQVLAVAGISGTQPERGVVYRPLVGPRSGRPRRSSPPVTGDIMERPLRLRPTPLELLPDVPTVQRLPSHHAAAADAPPTRFQLAQGEVDSERWGTSQESLLMVRRSWGPERLETGWWYGRTVRRDYWRVETEHGAQLWIYCDLRTLRWYLHGAF